MTNRRRYKSVLIVEDDIDIRESLKDIIESEGYLVFMASNGEEALKKLAALGEESKPCLIVTDLMMPKMDGWEFLKRLENDQTVLSIPVIVISAHGQGMPGYRFIRKPFNIAELIQAVEDIVGVAANCGEPKREDKA